MKVLALIALVLAGVWAAWFFTTDRDYGVRQAKDVTNTFALPYQSVPENVRFIRELAAKSDDEFLPPMDGVLFSAYARPVFNAYIEGLGLKPSKARLKRLDRIINGEDLDGAALARIVRLRITEGDGRKAGAVEILKNLAGMSTDGRIQVFNLLLNQMGEDQAWLGDLRNHIYSSPHADVVALGLRHLAAMGDQWVGDNIGYFLRHKEAVVRAAAVQCLRSYCSSGAEKFLSEMSRTEMDPSVILRVIDAVVEFPQLEPQAIYESLRGRFPAEAELQKKMSENLKRHESNPPRPACQ